jgi:hypothetical protein
MQQDLLLVRMSASSVKGHSKKALNKRFGHHTDNIWRGNLSFIQSLDNLVHLISGSVLHASRFNMSKAIHIFQHIDGYISFAQEIKPETGIRKFPCLTPNFIAKGSLDLCPKLNGFKPLYQALHAPLKTEKKLCESPRIMGRRKDLQTRSRQINRD